MNVILKLTVFQGSYGFYEGMQRIQNPSLTPDKALNILILLNIFLRHYTQPVYRSYKL